MNVVELNAPQQAAVEHGEGPLLIVAGAGTGKTEVIVQRVGYLLAHVPGLQPENILALTFARKAAEEMRHRAGDYFGPRALGTRFSTFHSFCYDLLREELMLQAVDKTDHWIFLRRHLEQLELDHYLKVSDPGRFLHDLVDFCSRCHNNLVSPAAYSEYVNKLAAEAQEVVNRGQPLGKDAEKELARLREHARVYELSESMLEQEGLLTFGAMISKAAARLKQCKALQRQLHQRFIYILVDEFQDTNAAQWELLKLLAGERQNVTAVGDDYQAIYRFRGAADGALERFKDLFPGHKRIVLNQNRRSTKCILNVAAEVSRRLESYSQDKLLTTTNVQGPAVEIAEYSDAEQEAEWVATEVARIAGTGSAEPDSSVAVLYRTHHHRDRLVEVLRRQGVPFAIRNLAINDLPVVRDLVAALRVIGDSLDSVSLVRVLAGPQWGLQPEWLMQYCREAATQRKSLLEIIEQTAPPEDWKGREALLDFLRRFATMAGKDRLATWFPWVSAELGLPHSSNDRSALETFSEFVTRWDKEKSSSGLLHEFLEYFQYFEEAGGIIALGEGNGTDFEDRKTNSAQPELWEATPKEDSPGKVQLMTLHGAKGLEFEHVFLFHMVRGAFPVRNRQPLIFLPDELLKGPLPKGDSHLDEERRLFYVGVTRAKRHLTLCTISNEKQRPSIFVDQLQDISPPHLVRTHPVHSPGTLPVEPADGRAPVTADAGSRLADWVSAPAPPPDEEFTFSISQLETYLECPLKFHFRHQWQIPVPAPPPLLFGIIVHGALKEVMAAVAQNSDGTMEEKIREILDRRWPKTGFPDPVQERKYRELGLEQLVGAAQDWGKKGIVLLYQERSFEIRSGGCRLVGRIDQLHRIPGGGVELVEYKTGRPQTQKEADRSQQITLYARACRQELGVEPSALILYNLSNREAIQTKRTAKEYRDLEQTIGETARQILAGSFPAQPGYHCRFCAYRAICPAQEQRNEGAVPSSI
ncbi:MAG: ATP-dependent helicase [Acidobacteria bacterium]|nr:ATP-dependent helicase [Acidobacteriota bacterium]